LSLTSHKEIDEKESEGLGDVFSREVYAGDVLLEDLGVERLRQTNDINDFVGIDVVRKLEQVCDFGGFFLYALIYVVLRDDPGQEFFEVRVVENAVLLPLGRVEDQLGEILLVSLTDVILALREKNRVYDVDCRVVVDFERAVQEIDDDREDLLGVRLRECLPCVFADLIEKKEWGCTVKIFWRICS
jgi:hypothetical protein